MEEYKDFDLPNESSQRFLLGDVDPNTGLLFMPLLRHLSLLHRVRNAARVLVNKNTVSMLAGLKSSSVRRLYFTDAG